MTPSSGFWLKDQMWIVNSLSTANRSPLFWPSCYGYERVVAILLEAKADPSFVDENGETASQRVARKNGHTGIAKALEDE